MALIAANPFAPVNLMTKFLERLLSGAVIFQDSRERVPSKTVDERLFGEHLCPIDAKNGVVNGPFEFIAAELLRCGGGLLGNLQALLHVSNSVTQRLVIGGQLVEVLVQVADRVLDGQEAGLLCGIVASDEVGYRAIESLLQIRCAGCDL